MADRERRDDDREQRPGAGDRPRGADSRSDAGNRAPRSGGPRDDQRPRRSDDGKKRYSSADGRKPFRKSDDRAPRREGEKPHARRDDSEPYAKRVLIDEFADRRKHIGPQRLVKRRIVDVADER